ncbi:MAG: SNF2-related protein, partial [Massilia sp.]
MASRLPVFITCALLSCGVGAAELGEPRISSYIGQPLVLELELTALASPPTPVQARLAHPDVYRGANIGMPSVLSTLAMRVSQRDGRQFLRVTSSAPVESSRLHLYLDLADGGTRDVRLVTLFIAPNPNPPAPAVPLPVPAPAPVPMPMPAKAPVPVVADLSAAPVVAAKPMVVKPRPPKPPKPPRPVMPTAPLVAEKVAPAPEAVAATQAPTPLSKPLPVPVPVALPAPASAATCAPASSVDSTTVCAALDVKNAQLREQIGTLEDKVRVLQVALGASPSAVVQDKVAPRAAPRPSRKRPAPEPEASTPWGWIAGAVVAVLALVGGALFILRRRKQDVATELPPRTETILRVQLQGKQRELYEAVRTTADKQVRRALERQGFEGS